jgi:hypothetical protein
MNQGIIDSFNELYDIYNTQNKKYIQNEEFINLLPEYLQLPGTTKSAIVNELPKRVTEKHLLEILLTMHNGYEYMSFYYLFKKYGKFNDIFRYRSIKQEAYYIYIILENLTRCPFISQYINHDIMNFIFQDKIEVLILPSVNQFKFDKCFPQLNIILEINEYAHESAINRENDMVKEALAVLCGMALSSLRIRDVFDMTEYHYKKLSDVELHETLRESQYLKRFLAEFNIKVLSSLLRDNIIRNDYIMYEFKNIINRKLIFLYDRFDNTFKQSGLYSETDKVLIKNMKSLIDVVNTSKNFIEIFQLKDKCVKSDSGYAITFSEVCELLGLYKEENVKKILEFKKFLFEETDIVKSINFDEQTHLFSWECLYTIVTRFIEDIKDKETLEMYLLYVNKTYEMVVKMINSHSKNLISNKHKLSLYINRFKESFHKKIQDENESLKKENSNLTEINAMYKKYFPDSHYDKDLNYTANNATRIDFTENLAEKVDRMNIKYNDIVNSDSVLESEKIKEIIEESDGSESDY